MSIYDRRIGAAYVFGKTDPRYADNPHIQKWWTPEHDRVIQALISEWQWLWEWNAAEAIQKMTDPKAIEKWRKHDPVCREYVWYNVLMYFCKSRAERLGYTNRIRFSKRKTCPLCGNGFTENSLPYPIAARLGMDNLSFCAPCVSARVSQNSGDGSLDRDSICLYLSRLSAILERVPSQGFGEGLDDLKSVKTEDQQRLLELLGQKPSTKRVKEVFGSWLHALIAAGVLEDGTRKTTRGVQCIAEDGHVCLSLGEKTIDDFLFRNGIQHDKEPRYPEGGFRGDFLVRTTIVEYFGLAGNPEYDAKIQVKTRICRKYAIPLVAIYPSDLISRKKLAAKLLSIADANTGMLEVRP